MTTIITTQSWNAAVVKQFPWISAKGLTSRIQISKVSPELLEVIPSEEYGTDLSGFFTSDQVQFWGEDGELLGEVNPKQSHADARDMSSDSEGETIGDAWARLKNPERVKYVTRETYYSAGCLSSDSDSKELEIFKVSRFDIAAWIEARNSIADNAVAAMLIESSSESHEREYDRTVWYDSPEDGAPNQWQDGSSDFGDPSVLLEALRDGSRIRVCGPLPNGEKVDLIITARPVEASDTRKNT